MWAVKGSPHDYTARSSCLQHKAGGLTRNQPQRQLQRENNTCCVSHPICGGTCKCHPSLYAPAMDSKKPLAAVAKVKEPQCGVNAGAQGRPVRTHWKAFEIRSTCQAHICVDSKMKQFIKHQLLPHWLVDLSHVHQTPTCFLFLFLSLQEEIQQLLTAWVPNPSTVKILLKKQQR